MGKQPDAKYWETKEFKALDAKWRKKLKKNNFNDIEQPAQFKSGKPDGNLKDWTCWGSRWSSLRPEDIADKEQYYRLAGQFLYDHKFTSAAEKFAWRLHSEGIAIVTIVRELNKAGYKNINGFNVYKDRVHMILMALDKLMIAGLA